MLLKHGQTHTLLDTASALSLEQEEVLFCLLLTTAKSDLCSGDLRRRRGTALPGLGSPVGAKVRAVGLSARAQESTSIHHPRESTHRNEIFNAQGTFTLLMRTFPCQWKESAQLHSLQNGNLSWAQSPASFSPHESSDFYTSNREPNLRAILLCWGSKMEHKDGYFSAWSGEQGQVMCFLAFKARENSHCSWVLFQSSADIGDIWIQACVLFLFNAYCRFAHLSPVAYWLFTRRRGKVSKTLHCPDSLIRTSWREGERKILKYWCQYISKGLYMQHSQPESLSKSIKLFLRKIFLWYNTESSFCCKNGKKKGDKNPWAEQEEELK